MAEDNPRPNRLKLPIPSDQVAQEAVSRVDPWSHPAYAAGYKNFSQEDLAGSIYIAMRSKETELIEKTFATALGRGDPHPDHTRESLVESLVADYQLFGVSSGRQHTDQLLRDLEQAVRAQALNKSGRNR